MNACYQPSSLWFFCLFRYTDSAKSAWSLLTAKGLDAVVNDGLVNGALIMAAIFGGIITGLFGGLVAYYGFKTGKMNKLKIGCLNFSLLVSASIR